MLALLLFVSASAFVNAKSNEPQGPAETPFVTFTFTLNSGDTVSPVYYSSGNKDINFSFAIDGTTAASEAALTVYNSSNAVIWSGGAADQELLWGNTTLTGGNNTLEIENTGPDTLTMTLKLFEIPSIQTPTPTYSWVGAAAPAGLNSEIEIDFPVSGLYTFDFSVNSGSQYEFVLDDTIQQAVTHNRVVSLYVEAGVRTVKIMQDTGGTLVNWQVDIAYSGTAADSLPYTKTNDGIDTEILPIHLSAAAQVNMVITATGTISDQLLVTITGADPQTAIRSDANMSVYAGETTWTTFDLPAGSSSIVLTTPGGAMDYTLEISVLPTADAVHTAGVADANGQHSKTRLIFETAGLYDFDLGSSGRYQFLLKTDGNDYIQKTVEGSNSVTYYVPAGTHDLTITQDTTAGAVWDVAISLNAANGDSLPYTKSGGEIGGAGNDFSEEWLPISLDEAGSVNMSIDAVGGGADSFAVEVYQSGSNSADYTLTQVLGSEEQWTNFQLSAGINRLKIVAANGNTAALSYNLVISTTPTTGTMSWSGNVLAAGLHPAVKVDFPTTALYRFTIDSADGFANLILDDHMTTLTAAPAALSNLGGSYDLQVEAGPHEIFVVQDSAYANTTWTASVAPSNAEPKFFEFTGVLDSGESVTPLYPVAAGVLDFNFSLAVTGDNVSLEITDGDNASVWSGTAMDGETIWGTGTLSGTNALQLTNTGGNSANVALTLYHIPTAGYTWDGLSHYANVVNSEIRVNFPTDGLYTFDLNADQGRYQLLLSSDYIQKTAAAGDDGSVTYYVPAGMQYLKIDQDSNAANTDWDVTISGVGAEHDTLPYTKSGGQLGGVGDDFTVEWLPINLASAASVNVAATITGTAGNSAVINILDANDVQLGSVIVNAGETTWTTLDLPAGSSRLHVDAAGNNDALSYELTVNPIPSGAAYTWDGKAVGAGANSNARVSFAESGLYTFTYGVDSGAGRYQFLVNENFIRKTVESDGNVVYYVPVPQKHTHAASIFPANKNHMPSTPPARTTH
jgi:hypothetical protein